MNKIKRGCCSCLFLVVLFLLTLLVLLVLLALNQPRKAHAQIPSVSCTWPAEALAIELAPHISEPLPSETARGIFFRNETVITATGQERFCLASSPDGRGDLRVDDQIELAVTRADSSTDTWQHDFGDPRTGGITAEPPHDVSTLFATGSNRVRLILRDTRPSVYSSRPVWLIVSRLPSPTYTPVLPTALPSVTPLPTTLSATATRLPEETPAPTATVASQPEAVSTHRAGRSIAVWPLVLMGGVAVAAVGGLVSWSRLQRKPKPESPAGDDGVLEICDSKAGDTLRVELRDLGLGEVWSIGNTPQCKIRVGCETGNEELGVLILTSEGPLIRTHGAPLWYDDAPVKEHLLFDGDDVYLGQFVLNYQNFFRRRGLDWANSDREGGVDER